MMRFLCLHGQGANSKVRLSLTAVIFGNELDLKKDGPDHAKQIFALQTAALRDALGTDYEYDFVDASVPCNPAPGIVPLAGPNDRFFSWFDHNATDAHTQVIQLLDDLDSYVSCKGPFDGIMAFSLGAGVAASFILHKLRQNPIEQLMTPTLRCAIFFSGNAPIDMAYLDKGEVKPLHPDGVGQVLVLPTANIWAANDLEFTDNGHKLNSLCDKKTREVVVHHCGHEVPGIKDRAALKATVSAIQRTTQRALFIH